MRAAVLCPLLALFEVFLRASAFLPSVGCLVAVALRGAGVFATISARDAREPPVVFAVAFRTARFWRPVVFLPEAALFRAGITTS